ncbi:hypothetical protein [Parasitella parasitica]|uniref:Uncharacterized protein n=1 Tax=Parasitella parasitica TaxID=35722 RepID=A0A0B7N340_9FUNG|nr:hypothetical protein [Parasitella parasitica]
MLLSDLLLIFVLHTLIIFLVFIRVGACTIVSYPFLASAFKAVMYLVDRQYSTEIVILITSCTMIVFGFLAFEIWTFVGSPCSNERDVSRGVNSPADACSSGTAAEAKDIVSKPAGCNICNVEQDCSCLAVERRASIVPAGAPAEPAAMAHPAIVLAPSSAVCAASVPSAALGARPSAAAPAACPAVVPAASSVASPVDSPVDSPAASPAASPVSPVASPVASPVDSPAGASSSAAAVDYLVSVLPLLAIYLIALLALHQLYLALMQALELLLLWLWFALLRLQQFAMAFLAMLPRLIFAFPLPLCLLVLPLLLLQLQPSEYLLLLPFVPAVLHLPAMLFLWLVLPLLRVPALVELLLLPPINHLNGVLHTRA